MTELATLGLSIRSDGVVVATDRLKDFEGAGRRAEGVAGSLVRTALGLGAAMAGAFSVRVLGNYADAWSDMQSRVGASIKNMAAAPALMQRITDIANASYSPLEQTAEIYSRNVGVLRDLGRGATEAADFTEALNHALVTTATRGERAASVQNALSKAMAVGKLQADGLESVLANGGRVAEALADELGTNVSGLRALASQGKITGDVIASALINRLDELREEAGAMDATLADAGTIWNNVFSEVVGRIDQAFQITGKLAASAIEAAVAFRGTADVLIRVGNILGSVVGPALDLIGSNIDTIGSLAGIAVAAMAGFYAPAMIGGLWSLSAALVTGVAGGIKAITLAMLANPLGLLIGGLAAAVTAAFMFRDQIKQAIGIDVVAVVKDGANVVIGAFVGAFHASLATWELLPSALGDLIYSTAQNMVNGVIYMIREAQVNLNMFLNDVEALLKKAGAPIRFGRMDLMGYVDLQNPYAGAAGKLGDDVRTAFGDAMSRDYVGELASSLAEVWTNAEGATGAMAGLMDAAGGGGAGAAGTGKESPYAKLVRGAHEFIAAQTLEQQALGMTAEAAQRLRFEQDLLNKAANDNIALTPAMRDELMGLAAQMAATEAQTKMLTQAANDNAALWGQVQDGVSGVLKTWMKGGDILDTISNKLINIADMLIDMAVRNLFLGAFGGGMGGGGRGGLLGGMIIPGILHSGGVAGADGYGHGRSFPASTWANAERYHTGGIAGLRANEVPAILERGETIIPRGASAGQQLVQVRVSLGWSKDSDGNIAPIVKTVAQDTVGAAAPVIVRTAVDQSSKAAPAAVAQYHAQRGGADWRTM